MVGFAALTGDWHPQHTDAVWAKESAFGERIAHGLFVISLAGGLVPFDPERVVALRRVGDVVFKRPVKLGDTLRVERQGARAVRGDRGGRPGRLRVERPQPGRARGLTRARVEVLWRADGTTADEHEDAYAVNGFVPIPL